MKLFRFGAAGFEKPGLVWEGRHLDVSAFGEDYGELFFQNDGLSRLREWILEREGDCPEISEGFRFGPPVMRPSKVICIGLNYRDHALESSMGIPEEPVVFFKSTTAIIGPNDPVVIPPGSVKTDWEVELAVVISKVTRYVKEEKAWDSVAGYMIHNDYSERAYQLERGGQWVKGKSADTFAPMGPYLVTPDEIEDVNHLRLWLTVNENKKQEGNTSDMVFDVGFIIHYLSQFMTLLPGDVISTGTPAGVGMGQKPEAVYLKPGDQVQLGIDELGVQKQTLVGS